MFVRDNSVLTAKHGVGSIMVRFAGICMDVVHQVEATKKGGYPQRLLPYSQWTNRWLKPEHTGCPDKINDSEGTD